jgi:hypothetical protein
MDLSLPSLDGTPTSIVTQTVLTLRSEDVFGTEVLKDGLRIDFIPGRGQART